MSNTFYYPARPDLPDLDMSNGLTSIFVSVMSMALSSISTENWQKRFAVCMASNDQFVIGGGMIMCDISHFPWTAQNIEAERSFMLMAIDAASAKTGWDRLKYTPKEESVIESLHHFRTLITEFSAEHIQKAPYIDRLHLQEEFLLCTEHGVYQHDCGCPVCFD